MVITSARLRRHGRGATVAPGGGERIKTPEELRAARTMDGQQVRRGVTGAPTPVSPDLTNFPHLYRRGNFCTFFGLTSDLAAIWREE